MLSEEKFEKAIKLLEEHFNKKLSLATISIWREYLNENLNDRELTSAIKSAIVECEFMPTPKQLVEFAKHSNENAQAYEVFTAGSLPSAEMKMTEEERQENLKRLNQMWLAAGLERKLSMPSPPSKEEIKQQTEVYKQAAQDLIRQWRNQGLI